MKGKQREEVEGQEVELQRLSFKGHVCPDYAMAYMAETLKTLHSHPEEERGIRRLVTQINGMTPDQGVQMFANLHMLNNMIANVMQIANEITLNKGFQFHFNRCKDEDQANIEVTLSVLEDYQVIPPTGPPDMGDWTDNEDDSLAIIGIE